MYVSSRIKSIKPKKALFRVCSVPLWCALSVSGSRWCSLVLPGGLFAALVLSGALWCSLVLSGAPCGSVGSPWALWCCLCLPGPLLASLLLSGLVFLKEKGWKGSHRENQERPRQNQRTPGGPQRASRRFCRQTSACFASRTSACLPGGAVGRASLGMSGPPWCSRCFSAALFASLSKKSIGKGTRESTKRDPGSTREHQRTPENTKRAHREHQRARREPQTAPEITKQPSSGLPGAALLCLCVSGGAFLQSYCTSHKDYYNMSIDCTTTLPPEVANVIPAQGKGGVHPPP